MRKLMIAILPSLLLFAAAAAVPQTAPPAPAQATVNTPPVPYTSSDGRFTVTFPGGTVKQDTQPIALQGSDSSTLYEYWVELDDDNVSYMTMYNDYPSNYANDGAQNVLARTRDGAVKGKTLTSDVAIDLNGVPGRAFTANDKDWNFSVHQFLSGKRLYQLIVVSKPDHPAIRTDEFMNSFRIQ